MFIRKQIDKKYFLLCLASATVVYFAISRIVQDAVYRALGLTRPERMFDSFGQFFARAEPLEMPLYFLGFVLIPLIAYLFHSLLKNRKIKYLYWVGAVVLVGGFVYLFPALVSRLPNPEIYLGYVREQGAAKALWLLLTKRIFVTTLLLSITAVVFVLAFLKKPSYDWIGRFDRKVLWKIAEPLFILFLIALAFHPNLPTQDHHYNYFIGTVNDIFQDKPLLYETTHLYGLLSVYFLLPIFSFLLPFSYASFSLVLFLFFAAFLIGLYYFLKLWLKSNTWAVLGTLAVAGLLLLFQTSPTRTAYFFPAMNPFRMGLFLPVLFMIYYYQKTGSRWLYHALVISGPIAFLWNLDSGAYLSVAIFLTLWAYKNFGLRNFFKIAFDFLVYSALVFGAVSAVNYLVYSSWPNWLLLVREISHFGVGIGMTPLPLIGVFEIFVLLYLATGLWLWRRSKMGEKNDLVLVYLVFFGVFSFLYYISESTWQNLYLVSIVPILIGLYYFKHLPDSRLSRASFYAGLFFTILLFAVKLPVEVNNRDYSQARGLTHVPVEDAGIVADAEHIKQNFAQQNRIPLMHLRDTKLLYYAQKANWFDFYYLFNLYYEEDIDKLVSETAARLPEYLFVGHETNDQIEYFVLRTLENYDKVESLNTLDVYRLKKEN